MYILLLARGLCDMVRAPGQAKGHTFVEFPFEWPSESLPLSLFARAVSNLDSSTATQAKHSANRTD